MKLSEGIKGQVFTVLLILFLTTNISGQVKKETFDDPPPVTAGDARYQKPHFYFEVNPGVQSAFGPSGSQAEISVYDSNSISFDKRKHFIAGFAPGYNAEFVAGYQKDNVRLQSSVIYFKQDIGLIQELSSNEYPFVLADMLIIKVSAKVQCSNPEKRGPNGFYAGFSIGMVTPISYKMNDQTKEMFDFKDFHPSAEFFWSVDLNYSIRLGKKGLYMIAGTTTTMPGLVGSVGKWEMQPNSDYTLTNDKVKMYSFLFNLGLGFRLI